MEVNFRSNGKGKIYIIFVRVGEGVVWIFGFFSVGGLLVDLNMGFFSWWFEVGVSFEFREVFGVLVLFYIF